MLILLKELLRNIKRNAVKIIAGAEVATLGVVYLANQDLFFYPPSWVRLENYPLWNIIAIFAGISLVIYGLFNLKHKRLNLILLCLATAYVSGILAILSLHVFGDHQVIMLPTMIGIFSILVLVWIASYQSNNQK